LKIWFTEIGEPLPLEGDVRLHRYGLLTQALASYGHDVTWWTSNFAHASKRFVCDEDQTVSVNGVRLRILKGLGYRRNISLERFRHQAHFARRFYEAAADCETPDVIVSPIPTIEAAEAAVRFARERKIPVLTDIRDEWPDEFLNAVPGFMRWAARIALDSYYRKMRFICSNVSGIMAISQQQLRYGLRFASRDRNPKDGVFPLGYATQPMDPDRIAQAREWWRSQGVDGESFTGCMFSSINKRVNLKTVIDAARVLEKEFPLKFVLCGDGKQLPELKAYASGVSSILFPGWVNGPQITALMEMSDVGLAPYARDVAMSLPNKAFEYFAGGLPVVSSIQGVLNEILERNDCGKTYDADSVSRFCDALRSLQQDPTMRSSMGERAHHLLTERFSTDVIARSMNEHLKALVRPNGASHG
jgi:glycosyltransferase involved in cell wall biosynthesis